MRYFGWVIHLGARETDRAALCMGRGGASEGEIKQSQEPHKPRDKAENGGGGGAEWQEMGRVQEEETCR